MAGLMPAALLNMQFLTNGGVTPTYRALECELFAAAGETIEFRQEKVAIRMALTVNMVKPLY